MLKKISFLFVALAMIFVAGCSSNPETVDSTVGADGTPRPDWVKMMSQKGTDTIHYEVGYGKMSSRATSLKRAEVDARNKIAIWLKADIQTALNTYMQDSGIGEESEVIQFIEEVSSQSSNTTISGAEIEDTWEDAEGGVYVLMALDLTIAAADLENNIYSRNDSAAFAEFKAREALQQLQATKEVTE